MIVGMPGAGISAFFYLLLVLLMPFRLAWHLLRRSRVSREHLATIAGQSVIAIGMIASFALIAIGLEAAIPSGPSSTTSGGATELAATVERGVQRLGALIAVLTLVSLLLFVQILATVARLQQARIRVWPRPSVRRGRSK